jgi:Leucine-rich repeat (LRR) protein
MVTIAMKTTILTLVIFLSQAKAQNDDGMPISLAQAWLDAAPSPFSGVEATQASALATLYYATRGDAWNIKDNWLSYSATTCEWYNQASPTCFATTGELDELILKENNLGGSIPSVVANLISLTEFDVDDNNVGGTLPTTFGLMDNLQEINIRKNVIGGPIPSELGQLTNLEHIYAKENMLTGTLPSEIGNMQSLEDLELSESFLVGSIPDTFANLSALEYLELFANDRLTGTIPVGIYILPELEYLSLEYNYFTDSIPTQVGLSESLEYISLKDNYFYGPIPSELGNITTLEDLRLDGNRLTGKIPTTLGLLTNLKELQLDENPGITGPIPAELGNCPALQELVLAETGVNGTVPSELTRLANLTLLDLNQTLLTGQIPNDLCKLPNLIFECRPGVGLCGCGCACTRPSPRPTSVPALRPSMAGGAANDDGGGLSLCFSKDMTVAVKGREYPVKMSELRVGDSILTSTGKYSTVYAFAHNNPTRPAEFLQIWTKDNQHSALEITGDHLVVQSGYTNPVRADSIRVGDQLQSLEGPSAVVRIEKVSKLGVYAPLNNEGTLVVNGIAASSYVSLRTGSNVMTGLSISYHGLIHIAVAPFRLFCGLLFPWERVGNNADGMPYYVAFGLTLLRWVESQHWFVQNIAMALILVIAGLFYGLELTLASKPILGVCVAVVVRRGVVYSRKDYTN